MKKNGTQKVLIFGLCMVAALSILYSSGARERFISANGAAVNRELPIHCVETAEKQIALSFDTTSGNEDIGAILETLANHDITSTFFLTGDWVKRYPEEVKMIQSAGHDLGSLGSSHTRMSSLSDGQRKNEFLDVHNEIKELTGVDVELFRPPYGDYNNDVILDARACDYYPVQWSVDSLDWRDYGVDSIVKTVCEDNNLRDGAIILCHNGTVV